MDDAGYCETQFAGIGCPRGSLLSVALASEVLACDVSWYEEAGDPIYSLFGIVTRRQTTCEVLSLSALGQQDWQRSKI